jgi:hypothetical protein
MLSSEISRQYLGRDLRHVWAGSGFEKCFEQSFFEIYDGVVYQVLCLGCAQIYIGNTIQYFKKIMSNHRTGISNMNPDYRALVTHSLENPSRCKCVCS